MQVTIKKWGNSASVRIPVTILEAANLKLDDDVEVREEDGRVVIEPVARKTYRLDDLLQGITTKNLHAEVSTGAPVGKEVW